VPAIGQLGRDNRIIDANERLLEMLGYGREEVIGHDLAEGLFHADKKIYPIDPLIAGLATAVNRRERFTPALTLVAESLLGVALFRATARSSIFSPPPPMVIGPLRIARQLVGLVRHLRKRSRHD
jgi:hypothetical protein